jgi:hypothetical protein
MDMIGMNPEDLGGRALDAAVARRVFNLEVEEHRNTRTGQLDFVYRVGQGDSWYLVPQYSQTMAASITLENELAKRGWHRVPLKDGAGPAPGIPVTVSLRHDDGRVIDATGLPEEALCRAALKALVD